jgi:hypothetical protein
VTQAAKADDMAKDHHNHEEIDVPEADCYFPVRKQVCNVVVRTRKFGQEDDRPQTDKNDRLP